MKPQQYREMNQEEQQERLAELQRKLFDIKTQTVTEKLENTKVLQNLRRDIARLKTIINQSQILA